MYNHVLPLEMGLQRGVKSGQVNRTDRDTPGPRHKIKACNKVTAVSKVPGKLRAQMTGSARYKDAQNHCVSIKAHPRAISDPGA